MEAQVKKFGTAPVFFTAISTILGAILFLRFGWAVGTLGFWGVLLIILLGHTLTIPTALALSEIATNKRVEGGGEYFIISRSFGLNIGATIGIALYMSQAISVAFYIIAFTESFQFLFNYFAQNFDIDLPRQVISIPSMALLTFIILTKGANMGVKALYFVVVILAISLILFFIGTTEYATTNEFQLLDFDFKNMDQFFVVFAIIFPAFTGMTAGVGLSGDLKNPSKSIPRGTIWGTLLGMIIYVFIIYKLINYASPEQLTSDQLVMAQIAVAGSFVIPLGLAASTISSALGSVMVAPRTLQALAMDSAFPSKRLNKWLSEAREKDNEPIHASMVTAAIAFVFVALGDVNAVAGVISMFFMVTYGSLCLISFLYHFGSSPSYRPSFRSKWYLSALGFIISVWVMFKINTPYAILAFIFISLIYTFINRYHKNRSGFATIFLNAIFQFSRLIKVYLQKQQNKIKELEWRPSVIHIGVDGFERGNAIRFMSWIADRYGFATYLHRIEGYYSKKSHTEAIDAKKQLLQKYKHYSEQVYIDTIISPSATSAIAQSIQVPGVSGMENNLFLFEFNRANPKNLETIKENFSLVASGDFDIAILSSTPQNLNYKNDIHVWIKSNDADNANLMILLAYIISAYPAFKKSSIKIFNICKTGEEEEAQNHLKELVQTGRLPISDYNIEIITRDDDRNPKEIINERSNKACITLVGMQEELLKHQGKDMLTGYEIEGELLFVFANKQIEIE